MSSPEFPPCTKVRIHKNNASNLEESDSQNVFEEHMGEIDPPFTLVFPGLSSSLYHKGASGLSGGFLEGISSSRKDRAPKKSSAPTMSYSRINPEICKQNAHSKALLPAT